MVKITLHEVEYETDNFDDEQKKIVTEIKYNSNLQTQIDYQLHSLRKLGETLVLNLQLALSDIDKPTLPKTKK
tara:strand:- start:1293 stop:1511 length:219 start_codon:yes stop_codon:yes gene_type:complete